MRRWRSAIARLSAVAMLASLLALVGGSTASADPVPATNWTPVTIGSDPGATKVETDASGGVTVGCPSSSHSTGFKSFSSSGSLVQNRPLGDPQAVFCTTDSVVGKDGTVYVTAGSLSSPTQYYVQAWKNNSLVWQYTIPCGSNAYPDSMVMGADDNMYMVVQYGSGSCGSKQLIGLSPIAQSGSNPPVPQVVMDQAVSVGWVPGNGLAAYNDGLVLYTSSGIKYVSYSGSSSSPVVVANSLASYYVQTTENWFAATTSGRVFVPTRANAGASVGCSDANNVVGSIVAVDPAAQNNVAWTINISACAYVHEIHPLPNNGFVMRYGYVLPGSGANRVERIAAYDSSSVLLWDQTVQDVSQVGTYAMSADLNGNVVLRADVALWHTVNGSTWQFPEIDITLFNGSSGAILRQVNLRGESDTTAGPSYKGGNAGELSMAKNTFYVTAQQCTNLSYCDASSTKLYAFTVPGLEMDYPRGAILGASMLKSSYAALGESFSSGEGVPPFDSFSDSDGCHRSLQAYSRIVAADPTRNVWLTNFVACSGATTNNVLNGQNGEGPQVNVLGPSIDFVTITIGGNDVGFGAFAQACVTPGGGCESTAYNTIVGHIQNDLPAALDTAYNSIKSHIGANTKVLVIGYPRVVPDIGAIISWPNCSYFQQSSVDAIRDVVSKLNQAISGAVGRAGSQFQYVSPNGANSPFIGHELCTGSSYFNGINVSDYHYAFHPNSDGQNAYAQIVSNAMNYA